MGYVVVGGAVLAMGLALTFAAFRSFPKPPKHWEHEDDFEGTEMQARDERGRAA